MIPWLILMAAGLLEIVWVIALKYSQGFRLLWPGVITVSAMIASFLLLAQAVRSLPLGLAYSVWVGFGAAGAVLAGAVLFQEKLSTLQVLSIACIALAIVALKAGAAQDRPLGPPALARPEPPNAPANAPPAHDLPTPSSVQPISPTDHPRAGAA